MKKLLIASLLMLASCDGAQDLQEQKKAADQGLTAQQLKMRYNIIQSIKYDYVVVCIDNREYLANQTRDGPVLTPHWISRMTVPKNCEINDLTFEPHP